MLADGVEHRVEHALALGGLDLLAREGVRSLRQTREGRFLTSHVHECTLRHVRKCTQGWRAGIRGSKVATRGVVGGLLIAAARITIPDQPTAAQAQDPQSLTGGLQRHPAYDRKQ